MMRCNSLQSLTRSASGSQTRSQNNRSINLHLLKMSMTVCRPLGTLLPIFSRFPCSTSLLCVLSLPLSPSCSISLPTPHPRASFFHPSILFRLPPMAALNFQTTHACAIPVLNSSDRSTQFCSDWREHLENLRASLYVSLLLKKKMHRRCRDNYVAGLAFSTKINDSTSR